MTSQTYDPASEESSSDRVSASERRKRPVSGRRRSRLSMALAIGALALLASLTVGPAAPGAPERTSAGTVIFIHDQEPPSLRGNWIDNNLLATGLVTNNIWYGGQIYDNRARLQPRLLAGQAEAGQDEPPDGHVRVQAVRRLERREARHLRGLEGDLAGVREPPVQRRDARGIRGRQVGHVRWQVRDDRLQPGRMRPGRRWCRAASTLRTSSAART